MLALHRPCMPAYPDTGDEVCVFCTTGKCVTKFLTRVVLMWEEKFESKALTR